MKPNKNFLKRHLNNNKYDIIIAADKGLESLDNLNIKADYIIGDFDSINKEILEKYTNTDTKIQRLNPEKDFTDTYAAIQLALNMKTSKMTIIGGIRR